MKIFIKKPAVTLTAEDLLKISNEIKSKSTYFSENVDVEDSGVMHSLKVDVASEIFSYFNFETFADSVKKALKTINLSDREFYKRSGIGRKIFWNIANNQDYKPSKDTAIACVLGLHLNKVDAERLLKKAGYALADCDLFDAAVAYCIEHEIYNIMDVNAILDELEIDKQLRTE